MKRSSAGWSLLLCLMACEPEGIVHSSCESVMLATGDPWECTLNGKVVDQASSISFDTESRNRVAEVELSMRVKRGALRVEYYDLKAEKHQLLVTPEAPLALKLQTRMHPDKRYFALYFDPLGKKVEGLTGTVKYKTP